jgi:HSP20 family protein
VYRSFPLAQDVDESGANAKFENGVLQLTLPKKAASKAKLLTIN